MKALVFITAILFYCSAFSQISENDPFQEILKFQMELTKQFKDTTESPLPNEEIENFTGHVFFPVDLKYRVEAKFVKTPDAQVFEMPTTTTRKPLYKQYAIAAFNIDSVEYHLALYQSQSLLEKEEYKDYLFLPFKDHTNGFETYGGGRYIDLRIPSGDTIIIDFNQSYNPYCAYSLRYSCPIPPDKNSIETRIEAGIRFEEHE